MNENPGINRGAAPEPPDRFLVQNEPASALPAAPAFGRFDRLMLVCAWLLGWLFVEIFSANGAPALGLFIFHSLFCLTLAVCCKKGGGLNRAGLVMLVSLWLLSGAGALNAQSWTYPINLLVLFPLTAAAVLVLNGSCGDRWKSPRAITGLAASSVALVFVKLDAPPKALFSVFKKHRGKRAATVLISVAAAIPVVLLVTSLLSSADRVFSSFAGVLLSRIDWSFPGRLALGALIGYFLYGAFYALKIRCSAPVKSDAKPADILDPVAPLILTAALDILYAIFAYIQFAYLFGGLTAGLPEGFSYSEYARNGFFELTRVSALNLAVLLSCVTFSDKKGPLWKAEQVLLAVLAAFTGLLLFSAAYRMSMYVGAYGLSRLRALTVWGMALILVLLAAAAVKIWRPELKYFPFFVSACMSAWLILNFANMDGVVARYNVDAYLTGNLETIDVEYLASLSPGSIGALEKLEAAVQNDSSVDMGFRALPGILNAQKGRLEARLSDWRTWDLYSRLAYDTLQK